MKKNLALCLSGIMIASVMPVSAQYETTVTLETNPIVSFGNTKIITDARVETSDAPKATFKVSGKSFALLDTDLDGNYLIISSDYYLRPWWDKMIFDTTISQLIETTDEVTGEPIYSVNILPAGTISNHMDAVKLTPSVEGTFGYWLNNTYLNSTMPASMRNSVVLHDWQSEAINTSLGNTSWDAEAYIQSKVTDYDKNTLAARRSEAQSEAYTVSAHVMIPSYSEYVAYKDKIGVRNNGWQGMMIRSVNASGRSKSNTLNVFTMGPSYLCGQAGNNVSLNWDFNVSPTSSYYYARPMFWVAPDFFKTVKLDIEYNEDGKVKSIGEDPLAEIKKLTYSDLINKVYSGAELEAIGFDVPEEFKGYGKYPEHKEMTTQLYTYGNAVPGASPAENVFYVNDGNGNKKGFVLLDRDGAGNYFVIAEDEYGTHSFTTIIGEEINQATVKDSEWVFDPNNTSSVANWLNDEGPNGFVAARSFPVSVYNHIIPFDWQVENKFTSGSISSGSVALEDYTAYTLWLKNRLKLGSASTAADPKFKLSLISYAEYMAYNDKIGATASRGANGWAGFMTRTVNSTVSLNEAAPKYVNNFYHICGSNGVQTKVRICPDGNLAAWCQNVYFVRPVFWLDKDFFKNVKLTVLNDDGERIVGSKILPQLEKYTQEELGLLYTSTELKAMGIDNGFEITDIVFKDAGDQELISINGATMIKAEFTFEVGKTKPVTLIVAVYDDKNKLIKIVTDDIIPQKGINTYPLSVDDINCGTNYKCKAIVWNSLENMLPYAVETL